jgi:hypothetical protein
MESTSIDVRLQVAGICTAQARLVGEALDSEVIVEPVRGPLIPGFRWAALV